MVFKGYECKCHHHYELSNDTKNCKDIDECSNFNKNNCSKESEDCINEQGGYKCKCKPGFTLANGYCQDIDECKLRSNKCHKFAECINIAGSFKCICENGYAGDGFTCIEILPILPKLDWCSINQSCGFNTICINVAKGPWCKCKQNYFGDPYKNCSFKSPSEIWRLKEAIEFPIKFKRHLKYSYSETFYLFQNDLKRFFEPILSLLFHGYIKDSMQLLNPRYIRILQ